MSYKKKWLYAIPFGLSLFGFYLTENLPNDWNVIAMFWISQYFAVVLQADFFVAGWLDRAYFTRLNSKYVHEKPREEEIINWHTGKPVESLSIPKLNIMGHQLVYTQSVTMPKFDKEKIFAVTLLRMHDFDGGADEHVDLTETKWVKSGKFIRAEFKAMLEVWEGHEVIRRKSDRKNAPYIVSDWRKVRLIGEGNPLPPLPR